MSNEQSVTGGIIVHSRTELYKIDAGPDALTYSYIDGTYTGDIDGPATEAFVVVSKPDGVRTTYGFGTFTGRIKGRSGTVTWKFIGGGGDGVIEILGGTGDLAGVTGSVPYAVIPGSANEFTYSGTISG